MDRLLVQIREYLRGYYTEHLFEEVTDELIQTPLQTILTFSDDITHSDVYIHDYPDSFAVTYKFEMNNLLSCVFNVVVLRGNDYPWVFNVVVLRGNDYPTVNSEVENIPTEEEINEVIYSQKMKKFKFLN